MPIRKRHMQNYELQERIAIKIDSHIPESLAIKQAKQEMEEPECVQRLQQFKQKKLEIDAEKKAKYSRKFNYSE